VRLVLRDLAKTALYRTGPLTTYHRLRNRRALTVIMFHRVLGRGDRRWAYCDPEYTIADDLFARCLEFFAAHYHIVSLDDVLAPGIHLPDHPLLITFDDGWADHEQVALPILAERGLPAVVFVAADAVDLAEPTPFWEIQLLHAFRRGALGRTELGSLWYATSGGEPPAFTELDDARALVARLYALAPERVPGVLAPYAAALATPGDRHLMNQDELANLTRHRIAIGGHGAKHRPLARVVDAAEDLRRSQAELSRRLGAPVPTMSFPHGSYDRATVDAARAAGFRALFTSDPILNPVPRGAEVPALLGRIGFDPAGITDRRGRFRPELLANKLWRAPVTTLTPREPSARA
jgi:peptidoglycan/xylan/chitin deacetylase (PgdA/CDA1 family)